MNFEQLVQSIGKTLYYQDDAVAIYCADCRDILPLIPDKSIDLVLTDPPYQEGDFSSISPMLLSLTDNLIITPGKFCAFEWIKRAKPAYEYIWVSHTQSLGGSACLHMQFEPILAYRFPHTPLGGDLLDYPIYRDITLQVINGHPWPKPVTLWSKLIAHWSRENDIILDPFLGSGTTAYCAKKLGRKCIGVEIEEKYCEIAARRCSQTVMRLEVK